MGVVGMSEWVGLELEEVGVSDEGDDEWVGSV